jgi:uncharacterized RDD family membrane protein YckC
MSTTPPLGSTPPPEESQPPTTDSPPTSEAPQPPPATPVPPAPAPASAAPAGSAPAVAWESPEVQGGPAPGVEFAPHGPRLVAYILDGIIIAIVVTVIASIGALVFFAGSSVEDNRVTNVSPIAALVGGILWLIAALVGLLYFPYFWVNGGATIGMRPFSLKVVRDRDGGAIGWGTGILRLIGLWIAGAVFYLGFIWIFIDKRRRGWQDLIAGTLVVKQE